MSSEFPDDKEFLLGLGETLLQSYCSGDRESVIPPLPKPTASVGKEIGEPIKEAIRLIGVHPSLISDEWCAKFEKCLASVNHSDLASESEQISFGLLEIIRKRLEREEKGKPKCTIKTNIIHSVPPNDRLIHSSPSLYQNSTSYRLPTFVPFSITSSLAGSIQNNINSRQSNQDDISFETGLQLLSEDTDAPLESLNEFAKEIVEEARNSASSSRSTRNCNEEATLEAIEQISEMNKRITKKLSDLITEF